VIYFNRSVFPNGNSKYQNEIVTLTAAATAAATTAAARNSNNLGMIADFLIKRKPMFRWLSWGVKIARQNRDK